MLQRCAMAGMWSGSQRNHRRRPGLTTRTGGAGQATWTLELNAGRRQSVRASSGMRSDANRSLTQHCHKGGQPTGLSTLVRSPPQGVWQCMRLRGSKQSRWSGTPTSMAMSETLQGQRGKLMDGTTPEGRATDHAREGERRKKAAARKSAAMERLGQRYRQRGKTSRDAGLGWRTKATEAMPVVVLCHSVVVNCRVVLMLFC